MIFFNSLAVAALKRIGFRNYIESQKWPAAEVVANIAKNQIIAPVDSNVFPVDIYSTA